MIQTLRKKFILATMLSLLLVLLLILLPVNVVTYRKTVTEADRILALLSENQGAFPQQLSPAPDRDRQNERPGERPLGRREFSPEIPFESRFFWVKADDTGIPVFTDTANIAAVDDGEARQYALTVLASGKTKGFLGDYRFLVSVEGGQTRVIFLDCGRSLADIRTTALVSLGMMAAVLLGVFILLLFFSGRIVKPLAESSEKQRRFITDAGHELKTPLTIIGADTDLLELEVGVSRWVSIY